MRVLLTLFSILSVSLLWYADNPERASELTEQFSREVHQTLFDKTFHFSGVEEDTQKELEQHFPRDRSVPWWLFNMSTVRAALMSDARVEKAEVRSCGFFEWGCFEIEIDLRKPVAAVELGGKLWMVSHDGVVLERRELNQMDFSLFLVQGKTLENLSSDILRATLTQVIAAAMLLAEETKTPVAGVKIEERGEISVWFHDFPPPVIFELGTEEGWEAELKDRSRRLVELRASLGEKASEVVSIDLAYQKLGVVRLRNNTQAKR